MHGLRAVRGHREHAGRVWLGIPQEGGPACMPLHLGVFVIVQPRTAHLAVFHREPERLDQVQSAPRVGRQANHIPRVGRYLGFDEDDMEHAANCHRWACELSNRS